METKLVKTQGKDLLIIKVSGNLNLEGYEEEDIRVQADPNQLKVFTDDEALRITCYANLTLSVPNAITTRVEKVGGMSVIRNIGCEELYVQRVGGDLTIQNVNNLRISRVGGGCQIMQVNGDLDAERISGSIFASSVEGKVDFASARSDVSLVLAKGETHIAASGDVTMQYSSETVAPIDLRSKGDITLMLPQNVDANLDATFGGWDVILTMDGKTNHYGGGHYNAELGKGGALITLNASGDIVVTDEYYEIKPNEGEPGGMNWFINVDADIDLGNLSNMERKLQKALEKVEKKCERAEQRIAHADERIHHGDNRDIAQRIEERARERAERMSQRISMKVEKRAREEALEALSAVKEQLKELNIPLPLDIPDMFPLSEVRIEKPSKPKPPAEAPDVSQEERMMVLQMLQEGRISLEEAEKLLSSLKG